MSLIAVTDLQEGVAGGIVYWRLSGAVDYDDLEAAWRGVGLDLGWLPPPVARTTALARTMATFKERHVMVKPLKGTREGFVLVHETYASERPTYRTGLEVTLAEDQMPALVADPAMTVEELVRIEGQVRSTFIHALTSLSQTDLSTWLVALVRRVRAVRLRDTGGIYFVPRTELALWRRFAGALREASACQLFEIPALQSEDAVAAVLDALTREAEDAVATLDGELGGELSARSLRSRTKVVAELESKLSSYEALLGVKQASLHTQFEALQARIANALLVLEED